MARFHQLCLDTANPASDIATFWAAVSGGRVKAARSGGPADVQGRADHESIAICPGARAEDREEPRPPRHLHALDRRPHRTGRGGRPASRGERVRLDDHARPGGQRVLRVSCATSCRTSGSMASSSTRRTPSGSRPGGARPSAPSSSDNAEHGGGWWTLLHATPDDTPDHGLRARPGAQDGQEPPALGRRRHRRGVPRRGAPPTSGTGRAGPTLADPEGNEFCVFPEG